MKCKRREKTDVHYVHSIRLLDKIHEHETVKASDSQISIVYPWSKDYNKTRTWNTVDKLRVQIYE